MLFKVRQRSWMIQISELTSLAEVTLRQRFESSVSGEILLPKLMCLFDKAQKASSVDSTYLMSKTLSIILAMSTSSTRFWQKFKVHPEAAQAIQALLLGSTEDGSKDDVPQAANQIGELCCQQIDFVKFKIRVSNPLYAGLCSCASHVDHTEFLQFFWPLLVGLVPNATSNPKRCGLFLNLVQQVLGAAISTSCTTDASIDCLDLGALSRQWGKLLISHAVVQVRQPLIDLVTILTRDSMLAALQTLTL